MENMKIDIKDQVTVNDLLRATNNEGVNIFKRVDNKTFVINENIHPDEFTQVADGLSQSINQFYPIRDHYQGILK